MWEWRYSSIILDLSTRWRFVINFMPWPLYLQEKKSLYPLDSRLDGSRNLFVYCRIDNRMLPLLGVKPQKSNP
jgi:hypothetical protein